MASGRTVTGGVALVDGAYHWTVAEKPRLGREVLRIATSGNDTWLLGYGISRWDGQASVSVVAPAPLFQGVLNNLAAIALLDDVAVTGTGEVLGCGSEFAHLRGGSWELVGADGGLGALTCEVAANGPHALRRGVSDDIERWSPALGWVASPGLTQGFYASGGGCLDVMADGTMAVLGAGLVSAVRTPRRPEASATR